MRIRHRAVPNPIYELVKTFLVDLDLGETITVTVQLYRNTEQPTTYRARLFEKELFRLTPTFPRDTKNRPKDLTDDNLNVERHIPFLGVDYDNFTAKSIKQAQQILIEGIRRFVVHSTGKPQ